MQFRDRLQAGNLLAQEIGKREIPAQLVLAIPRGGVVVGREVAKGLSIPLDVIVARKVGAPDNPELAIGAVTSHGHVIWNRALMSQLSLRPSDLDKSVESARHGVWDRIALYRGDHRALETQGRHVVLVDDGIATGFTVSAALESLRESQAASITLAVPVAPQETLDQLSSGVDQIVCLKVPEVFWAVSAFFRSFPQVSDQEVIDLLEEFRGGEDTRGHN